MQRRVLFVLVSLLTALLWAFPATQAQDSMVVSNLVNLAAEAFSSEHGICLPWFMPWEWQAFSLDGGEPWWVDCSQVPCTNLPPASTDASANALLYGVTLLPVQLTLNILTGETTLQPDGSTNVVAVIAAPSDYQPGTQLGYNAWVWREWQQVTNCLDCWGIEGEIPPPTVFLRADLADINQYSTYEANVAAQEAQAEAAAEAATASATSLGSLSMSMDDDDGGGADPCTLTSLTQAFSVTNITRTANGISITFQSCQFFRYLIFTASQLSSNTVWLPQAYIWGIPGHSSTTWTDLSTTNNDGNTVTQRFYRVQRILGSPIAAGGGHSLAVTPDGKLWS